MRKIIDEASENVADFCIRFCYTNAKASKKFEKLSNRAFLSVQRVNQENRQGTCMGDPWTKREGVGLRVGGMW